MRTGIKWMQDGPFGIMVHYLSSISDREGNRIDFNEMADKFDIPAFMDNLEKMGAKWIIFPFGQNTGYYWSENPYIEEKISGRCSKRDIMLEVATACKERDIKFIAYLPCEMDDCEVNMRNAFKWDESPDKHTFMELWMQAIEYWAKKLGDSLSGWWFDGSYESREKYFKRTHDWDNQRYDVPRWFAAARAGNPDCKVAICRGANDRSYVFFEQDYFAGECNDLEFVPLAAVQDGIQRHSLVWIDCYWAVSGAVGNPDIPNAPRFTDDELYDWVKKHNDIGSGVTLNIGIYNDSSLIEESVEQICRIRKRLGK